MKVRSLVLLLVINLLFIAAALARQGPASTALASGNPREVAWSGQEAGSPALSEDTRALQQETPEPTRVRPTPTPIATPPPADPESTNLMIGFGVLAVVVVIVGVWLNRERTV